MIAITYNTYGPPEVLRVDELPTPSPAANEVLVRTKATTVTSGDWRARSLDLPPGFGPIGRLIFGFRRPRQPVLGSELSGVVEEVGGAVTDLRIGDEVFVFTGANLGCYAEFLCVAADGNVVKKPENLSFAEAASLGFGGTTALDFFRKAKLQPGERVLINGASGGVGTTAVQVAKHLGAEVTGVCSSSNIELVRSLGADHVIDYTSEDFTQSGETYDVIMDTAGTAPYARCKPCLAEAGRLVLVLGGLSDLLRIPWVAATSTHRIIGGAAAERRDDLQEIAHLATTGAFRPVIDRSFPVEEIVEAHRYVDTGRKRGSVVVTWDDL